jgi:tetrahydromethanopterin S-methyltransferase subunit E
MSIRAVGASRSWQVFRARLYLILIGFSAFVFSFCLVATTVQLVNQEYGTKAQIVLLTIGSLCLGVSIGAIGSRAEETHSAYARAVRKLMKFTLDFSERKPSQAEIDTVVELINRLKTYQLEFAEDAEDIVA